VTASPTFKRETEAVGIALADREAGNCELAFVHDLTCCQRNKLEWNGCPSLAPEAGEHPDDDLECGRACVYRHDVSALSQPQGRKETGNAEHVVEMAVSQQEPIEPSKAGAAAQQLALRPFSAIHQNTVTSDLDEETGMIPFGRRNACRSS
jgi:hypothetical protein